MIHNFGSHKNSNIKLADIPTKMVEIKKLFVRIFAEYSGLLSHIKKELDVFLN